MDPYIQMIVTIFASVAASSGFWTWLSKKSDKNSDHTKLLLGICHDRILTLGMFYIERGFLTQDEYTNIIVYLGDPYLDCNGNGTAKRIIGDVKKLPIRPSIPKIIEENANHD